MRFQSSFVVLFDISLGQTRGLNHNRFACGGTLLCASNAGKDAKTEGEKDHVAMFDGHIRSEGHRSDYSLVPLDAAAALTISW